MAGGYTFELGSSILADNLLVPAGGTLTDSDCDWEAGGIDNSAGYNFVEAPGSCVLTQSGTDTTLVDPQLDSPTTGPCATPLADGSCLATLP